jgi:acyl dehydratase
MMITREIREGQELNGNRKVISWQRIWAFSGGAFAKEGWPKKNLHTDTAFARSVGLASEAASGTQIQGYVIQMAIDLFGEEWLKNGTMDVKFIGLVKAGDSVISKARVTSKEKIQDKTRVTLDVWVENQEAEKVLVGNIAGFVR